MKICLITTSFPRHKNDDAGIFIARIVSALNTQKIQGIVIAPFDIGANSEEPFLNWTILRAKYGIFSKGQLAYGSGIMPNIRSNPLCLMQVPALLIAFAIKAIKHSKDCDLIHSHWLASAIPGIFASKICKKPLVVSVRGEDLKLLQLPIIGHILVSLLNTNAQITTVSEHFEQRLKKYFPNKSIYLIRNGVAAVSANENSLAEIQQKHGIQGLSYWIHASRVIPLKRVELLLKLTALLQNKNMHLVVCGALEDQQYLAQLKIQISDLGLDSRVHFLGPTNPDENAVLLSGAKLYCSASQYEGRSNSVLEALAQGIPPVLSDIPGHSALIEQSRNGILFSVDGLEAGAKQIDKLLIDSNLYQEMSKQAKQSVSDLSWENCANAYIETYKIALQTKPS